LYMPGQAKTRSRMVSLDEMCGTVNPFLDHALVRAYVDAGGRLPVAADRNGRFDGRFVIATLLQPSRCGRLFPRHFAAIY
jgi:hypothetical protein